MRIAVDAMGGDFAPHEIVKGAVESARRLSGLAHVTLVGDQDAIRTELDACPGRKDRMDILHASEVVGMHEAPAQAIRRKKDSSIGRAVDLMKAGDVSAVVSAGNTGAVVVAATLKMRALAGVDRPAIAAVMPTPDRPFILIDAGANIDSTARMLAQFATMGHVYSHLILGQENPVSGLLSIGGEEIKGNDVTRETYRLLADSPLNFRGNIEGHDLFRGETDVVACDGFVGNIVLKTSESMARAVSRWTREEFSRNPLRMAGALMLTGALKAMKRRLDPEMYGGAPLLGVNGVCIITHGSSSAKAIYHAISVSCESVHHRLNEAIVEKISSMDGRL